MSTEDITSSLMHIFFHLFSYIFFAISFPLWLLNPKLRFGIIQRLGFHKKNLSFLNAKKKIWMHGASAGDVTALYPLAKQIRKQNPTILIAISTITDSGFKSAHNYKDVFDIITYKPFDLSVCVNKTFNFLSPDALILEYTELWPHLIFAAKKRNIPIFLHNGRFSSERILLYKILFFLCGNLLIHFHKLLLKNKTQKDNALKLGAHKDQILISGNTKYDSITFLNAAHTLEKLKQALGVNLNNPVLIAGSTHFGEEKIILKVFKDLKKKLPLLQLIFAPRYLNRITAITALIKQESFSYHCRSQTSKQSDIILLDTTGELCLAYNLADIAFVGGSFIKHGGHNILEPASCEIPVIFGPNMNNFRDEVSLLLGKGGIQVDSAQKFYKETLNLFLNPKKTANAWKNGKKTSSKNSRCSEDKRTRNS